MGCVFIMGRRGSETNNITAPPPWPISRPLASVRCAFGPRSLPPLAEDRTQAAVKWHRHLSVFALVPLVCGFKKRRRLRDRTKTKGTQVACLRTWVIKFCFVCKFLWIPMVAVLAILMMVHCMVYLWHLLRCFAS
ncbi:unnamed protein product [Miscanthus streak virus - [91]]|uniref:ORF V0 n=1 Tax=Miscanthus streak virus (isolate 91) TaxID=268776 RepID=Q67592_MISV9|nr:unnamed protein product [Miscanthus streak virus - [91]]BAA00836.1 unnamed protein product [Miscanthus streak virus - [91]]